MTAAHPIRFGVGGGTAQPRDERRALVRRAEALGYAVFLVADHYVNEIAPIAALMAAADAAETIRIGSFVFNNDLRHPIQLAKEVATLDLLSGGRFELGIGAGWNKAEYDQVGLPFDRPGVRIERLAEAVTLIKQFFTQESVTFAGNYYRVTGLETSPKSPQHPHPPIFIGGGGERVLSLAGREANIVGVHRRSNAGGPIDARERTEAALAQKVAWVRQAAGERFASLELNMQLVRVMITENRQQAAEDALREFSGQAWAAGITPEVLLADPYWVIGSVDHVMAHVRHLHETYGISYFMVDSEDMETFAPVVAQLSGT
jgi:probable F420-dependent oxidoreductase